MLSDAALDDLVDFESLLLVGQPVSLVLVGKASSSSCCSLVFGQVELAEQIAIDHAQKSLPGPPVRGRGIQKRLKL